MKLFRKDPQFYKNVFTLALPIAAQSLITIGVNMLDIKMVGKLGDSALVATSQANSFINVFHILCMGLGMGASVLVSRYWGMKRNNPEDEKATLALKQTVCLMLRLTLILATLFALATLIAPEFIMKTYTESQEVRELGVQYLRFSIITFYFLGLAQVTTIVLRSVGQVQLPLYVSIGAFFVNLIANYTFIFGKFGAPRMGVAGAGLGTLIARIFESSIVVGYLLFVDKRIAFKIKDIFMKTRALLGEYIKICIPVLVSDLILALGMDSVTKVIGHLNDSFAAANSITDITQRLSSVMITGVSQAGAIVTGQTLGMGDRDKTMKQGWQFFGLGLALGLVSAIFIIIVKDPVVMSFKEESEFTKEIAKQLMWAISLIVLFQSTNSIMTKGVLRGGGDTKMLMLTDNVFLWVVAIPLGLLAGYVFKLSPFWIYICLKSDQIIKTVWCIFRLKGGKWIKKVSTGKN